MSRKICALLVPVWLLFSCTNVADEGAEKGTESKPLVSAKPSLKGIQQLVQNKQCQAKSDCGSIGIGHRACGGPESYLVYSKKQVDKNKLEAMVSKYNEAKKEQVKKSGMMSTCMMLMPPAVDCKNNMCAASSSKIGM